jgi:LysM repeat protein
MNNHNPLIPQGSALEQQNKGRARVKIAVFFVLAVHGVGLMALLMQGCGQSKEPMPPIDMVDTNPPPSFVEPAPIPETTSAASVVATAPTESDLLPPPLPPEPSPAATEYTIVKGDYLEKIAKNFHVSVRALMEANPGIEPTRLQIGQKINIPAPATLQAPAPAGAVPAEAMSAGGEHVYTVKSGDNLTKIAAQYGTTVRALRTANGLRTDSIKVGQKLTIPGTASVPTATPVVPVEPAPMTPAAPPQQ